MPRGGWHSPNSFRELHIVGPVRSGTIKLLAVCCSEQICPAAFCKMLP